MEEIVSLCKRRGFVYQTSLIYGGLANAYDYGPLGVELLKNIRRLWWRYFITQRRDMVGLDSQIILHPRTWQASGHVSSFYDPLVEDKVTHKRYRADHLIKAWVKKDNSKNIPVVEDMSLEEIEKFIEENGIRSPDGNLLTPAKKFDLLVKTYLGVVDGGKKEVFLRGETAQGIFTNFKNVLDSTRLKLPFGIGQIGKSFRNEITQGQFIFRTFEFEQAEIEYFFDPEVTDWKKLYKDWQEAMVNFVNKILGIKKRNLRWRRHTDKERSHYSRETYDLDYQFPFGWEELWGLAYRTDYDLKRHIKFSGENLRYTDPKTGKKFVPHVIEPAVGINRIFLMIIADAFVQEKNRLFLKLSPRLAPYQVAVFPLLANKKELVDRANNLFLSLKDNFSVYWDDRGNIGKRYRYQDEIGTPFCLTIDYQTLENNTVTLRDRDTMIQKRLKINQLNSYFKKVLI